MPSWPKSRSDWSHLTATIVWLRLNLVELGRGELLRRWKFSDNFLRPSGHHPLWHVTRLTLEVVELSKWRNIWKLRSGSTADYYDQRPRLVTSLSRCVDFVYMPHTHYHVKMFQNKAKKFHWFEKNVSSWKGREGKHNFAFDSTHCCTFEVTSCLVLTSSKTRIKVLLSSIHYWQYALLQFWCHKLPCSYKFKGQN